MPDDDQKPGYSGKFCVQNILPSLIDMISALTRRDISIQEKKPITIIIELNPCLKKMLITVTRPARE